MEGALATGVVRGSHGVEGYLRITSYSGEYEHFRSLKDVTLVRGTERRVEEVEAVRLVAHGVLIKFARIDTPEAAGKYTNWEIWVPRRDAAQLANDEYYVADLVGCTVLLHGEAIGELLGIVEQGSCDLAEVRMRDGAKHLIPFRDEFIGNVNLRERTVELVAEWIVE